MTFSGFPSSAELVQGGPRLVGSKGSEKSSRPGFLRGYHAGASPGAILPVPVLRPEPRFLNSGFPGGGTQVSLFNTKLSMILFGFPVKQSSAAFLTGADG